MEVLIQNYPVSIQIKETIILSRDIAERDRRLTTGMTLDGKTVWLYQDGPQLKLAEWKED